ncbi:hypothetical protein BCON_0285g00040 [Botryotinia convoluta]|uniref:Uncharacterized protein n=1 Tax=Botryotinia convoluta TaxID=54673 RepID=A0A4Z1HKI5_9HELO|nr:hypothetical protein BCON_0285g00040 [Botryotinia convoluta]
MAREKWTKKIPKGGDAPKSQPQKNKSDNKPNDEDVLGLCKILLPELQEIIKKGVVPHDSILHSVLRNTLCTVGVVPVIRSLTAQDNPESAEMAHPKGITVTKLTTAVVDLFNENIVRRSVINQLPESSSHSSEPIDDKGRTLAMIESQKHMRLEFLVTSTKVPVELPLNERMVFIMKEHETSDEPYLAQSDFPEYISISEESVDESLMTSAFTILRLQRTEKDVLRNADWFTFQTCRYVLEAYEVVDFVLEGKRF